MVSPRVTEAVPARVEIELDIFSGMPNPTWTLEEAQADSFVRQMGLLAPTSAAALSGRLGYRGFIVQVADGPDLQLIRIQSGIVHIIQAATTAYRNDKDRGLERWLLRTGMPYLKKELLDIVERELR